MTMTPERLIELYVLATSNKPSEHCQSQCTCGMCNVTRSELLDLLQPHARGIEAMIEREVEK